MALEAYRKKRRFAITPEPRGAKARAQGNSFVIQKHAATRLHYDLRLELDGVMLSWAVARGPSLVAGEKRLAVHTEDHPIEYNQFEGTIPKGEYGGGTVMIWDRGIWIPEGDARKSYKKGHLDFRLEGEKLHGGFHLVRMRQRPGERQESWLLIKASDDAARSPKDRDILEEMPLSVASGRNMDEIAATDAVWHSNRPPKATALTKAIARIDAEGSTRTQVKASPRAASPTRAAATSSASNGASRQKAGRKSQSTAQTRSRAGSHSNPIGKGGAAPLPEFVEPCLALVNAQPPEEGHWVHEIKFDGYRMQARVANGTTQLKSRNGLDWTDKFRGLPAAIAQLPGREMLIDGEVVVEKEGGISSFSALQEELKSGGDAFVFYAFDLLHLDGRDLRSLPLLERKRALRDLLSGEPPDGRVRFSDHFETSGSVMLKHACEMKLEGIISKLADGPYRSGRTGDWIKTKCADRQEFVILGFVPATNDARAVGAVILGYYDAGALRYAGRVGTGFTHKGAQELWRRLQPLRSGTPPFKPLPAEERNRGGIWLEPKLVAEIEFRGWTHGDRIRQGSFKGLREDKPAEEIVRETPPMSAGKATGSPRARASKPARSKASTESKPAPKPSNVASAFPLTNPQRVYWEDVGLTKQGLAEYYMQVWEWIAPHVTKRALSLVRCPEGTDSQCFFQKHASAGLDGKRLKLVPEDGDHVISIEDRDGLLALVQAGVLEIHVRGSTTERLDAANRIVFDLDPAPEVGWPEVVRATREVRERLSAMGLESFLKTTGGKGLHVVLPIEFAPWDEVKAFARSLAYQMAADSPSRYLATASKRDRTGRIFVDYLRNSREATAICAYSTRARPGATVSVPITWTELGSLKTPNQYTVGNLMTRLRRLKRDPWADIGKVKQRLPKTKARG